MERGSETTRLQTKIRNLEEINVTIRIEKDSEASRLTAVQADFKRVKEEFAEL